MPILARCILELGLIIKEFHGGDINSRLEGSERINEGEVKSLYSKYTLASLFINRGNRKVFRVDEKGGRGKER